MIDEKIGYAVTELLRYKDYKRELDSRVERDEEWYSLSRDGDAPASAWLFNTIINKHADVMDAFPSLEILPRESGDEEQARALTTVIPAVLDRAGFEKTYSDNWWEKLKHGTAAYGVFYDGAEIAVRKIDVGRIYWEPGVDDIQNSKNLFIVGKADREDSEELYPHIKDGKDLRVPELDAAFCSADGDKLTVVDWYYKKNGRVHLRKFAGRRELFCSENDYPDGFYAHGKYPVVLDALFPEKGTPAGFGFVTVCKSPQMYIDKLGQNIMDGALMGSRVRYFASESLNVNEEEFTDWSRPLVRVTGAIDDTRLRQIKVNPPDPAYLELVRMKVEEMKETSGNRDFNAGGAGRGVTAASAIYALQEAGNKTSRDMTRAAYRAYAEIGYLVISLMRQFYSPERVFRISGERGYAFKEQGGYDGLAPVFDISVTASRRDPASGLNRNEFAKTLFQCGFFDPARRAEARAALELMEFEGKGRVAEMLAADAG